MNNSRKGPCCLDSSFTLHPSAKEGDDMAKLPERARILIVDDDTDTCSNLCDILTDLGYQVDTAHDGFTALEMARARHYDVALLDLKMPGMDGLTLYRELRRVRADTVAIIVTAYAGSGVVEEALA